MRGSPHWLLQFAVVLAFVPHILASPQPFDSSTVLGTGFAQGRPAAGRDTAQSTFPEMLDRINQVNSTLETFIVEQLADVRVLWIFRLRLRATWYVARPLSYKVVFQDPPWFLRRLGTAFGDITSAEELGTKYRASAIRPRDQTHVIAELVATSAAANPPVVTVTVNTARWVIDELVLKYTWGDVQAVFRYEDVEGYLLPTTVRISVSGFVIDADLTFSNYRLNVPLPPGTFGRSPSLLFG